MYIKTVSIQNFRAIEKLDLQLSTGVNILFGSNEAGKSTFLDAIHAAFFVNADSGKVDVSNFRRWDSQADPFVHVVFDANGREYELEKSFLGSKKGRLTCKATGLDTSNKDRINEELANLIPLWSGDGQSLMNTFWIAQRELESTAAALKKDSNLRSALQHIIFRADGDVEEIKKFIKKTITEYKKGLERHAERPGPVAQARDEVNRLEEEVNDLRGVLDSLERNIAQHKELTDRVAKLDVRLKEDTEILQAVEKYRQAKKNLEDGNKNLDVIQEEIESFQSGEKQIEEIKTGMMRLQTEREECDRALSMKQKIEERNTLESRMKEETALAESVKNLDAQISVIKKEEANGIAIPKEELEKTRQRLRSIEVKRESLRASQFSVRSTGLPAASLEVSEDGAAAHDEALKKGETKTFRANQQLRIVVPNVVELNIESGVSNAEGLQKELNLEEQSLSLLLNAHGVQSVEELAEKFDARQKLVSAMEILETEKRAKLNSRSLQDVEQSVAKGAERHRFLSKEIGEYVHKADEPADALQQRAHRLVAELAGIKAEMNHLEQLKLKFLTKYGTIDQAIVKRKELAREAAKADAALEETTKMELEDDKIFTLKKNIETARIDFSKSRDELLRVSERLQTSTVSSDQLRLKESDLDEARVRYESNLNEYEAYKIVDETLAEAEAQVAAHLMQPVEEKVKPILPKLTDSRYSRIVLNEGMEITSIGYKQLEVLPENLSTGTQGQVALALRLALIQHLSGKGRQTVVIDDALVNFDSHRLAEGKKLLTEFAEIHQVVYMSCHPEIRNWDGAVVHELS